MKRSLLVWSCCASMLLSACGNPPDDHKPDDGNPNQPNQPTTLTVTGKVRFESGQALKNVQVLIPGEGRQPVNVDDSGAFSIPGVRTPYDLIVASKERQAASVYKGLTLKTPTVALGTGMAQGAERHEARIQGTVTGARNAPSSEISLGFAVEDNSGYGFGLVESSGEYSLDASWEGVSSIKGTVYALQLERDGYDSPPKSYLTFGQRDVDALKAGDTLSAQEISLAPVTNSSLAGNITLPNGYVLDQVSLDFNFGANRQFELFSDESPKTVFQYAVPQLSQATYSLRVSAHVEGGTQGISGSSDVSLSGLTAGTSGIAVVISEGTRLIQPAKAATGVTREASFSWSKFANGVHQFAIMSDKSENQTPYTLTVLTSGTETTLPDLSPFGIALPASTEFSWFVVGTGPVASVDELVGQLAEPNEVKNSHTSVSEFRSFTTAATP
ncbi:MAG: carboxypeptidase-like regulatory domain-containing protein [Cystobacter sp.]